MVFIDLIFEITTAEQMPRFTEQTLKRKQEMELVKFITIIVIK